MNYVAGKNSYIHSAFYGDVTGGIRPPQSQADLERFSIVKGSLVSAVELQKFEWVVTGATEVWLPYYLDLSEATFEFAQMTGAPAQAEFFLRKNPFARGGEIPLTDASFQNLFDGGWSEPEEWGRYILGDKANIKISLDNGNSYLLLIEAFPRCTNIQTVSSIAVLWNEEILERAKLNDCENVQISVDLHAISISPTLNTLSFEIDFAEDSGLVDAMGLFAESIGVTSLIVKVKD